MSSEPLSKNYSISIGLGLLITVVGAAFYLGKGLAEYTTAQRNYNVSHSERTAKIEVRLESIDSQIRNMKVVQDTLSNHQTQITDIFASVQHLSNRVDKNETELIEKTRSRWSYTMMLEYVEAINNNEAPVDIEVIRARHLYPTE